MQIHQKSHAFSWFVVRCFLRSVTLCVVVLPLIALPPLCRVCASCPCLHSRPLLLFARLCLFRSCFAREMEISLLCELFAPAWALFPPWRCVPGGRPCSPQARFSIRPKIFVSPRPSARRPASRWCPCRPCATQTLPRCPRRETRISPDFQYKNEIIVWRQIKISHTHTRKHTAHTLTLIGGP